MPRAMKHITLDTPIGRLLVGIEGSKVTSIAITDENHPRSPIPSKEFEKQIAKELEEYFNGERREFSFPIKPKGSPFQMAVWKELQQIPYGSTATYGEIAARIGNPKASRAVGMACNRNPILVAVPCHRVVGGNGKLTGFAAGTDKKEFLLKLENSKF